MYITSDPLNSLLPDFLEEKLLLVPLTTFDREAETYFFLNLGSNIIRMFYYSKAYLLKGRKQKMLTQLLFHR